MVRVKQVIKRRNLVQSAAIRPKWPVAPDVQYRCRRRAAVTVAIAVALACGIGASGFDAAHAAPAKARSAQRSAPKLADQASVRPPAKPARTAPAGPLQIVVSLAQQRLTVFSAGQPILSSAVSSGQSGYDTPPGIYTILQKNRHHESNIYSGAPMPFMQRITWSGIALHEGNLPGHAASHGCIRLPGAFAQTLFGLTKVGARVIVARDPLTPRPFAHDKLFKPEQQTALVAALAQPPQDAKTPSGFLITSAIAAPAGAANLTDRVSARADTSDHPAIVEEPVTASRADLDKAKSKSEGLVSVLVSRQTGRIYIRQNFEPLHEAPITIQDADLPLGTHLFTAIGYNADKTQLVWNVVTYPMEQQRLAQSAAKNRLSDVERADAAQGIKRSWVTPPGAALERIEFGEDISEILAEVARPGMSLIITDKGLGSETGKGTEFVIQPKS
jgi:lipoprotein-anchoring transpeptidase ErfK/SrfK